MDITYKTPAQYVHDVTCLENNVDEHISQHYYMYYYQYESYPIMHTGMSSLILKANNCIHTEMTLLMLVDISPPFIFPNKWEIKYYYLAE